MIADYISQAERIACIKAGALAKCAELDAEEGGMSKEADGFFSAAKDVIDASKGMFLLSIIGAGVPAGVAGHLIDRRVSGKRVAEEELKAKIKLYRDAANEIAGVPQGKV